MLAVQSRASTSGTPDLDKLPGPNLFETKANVVMVEFGQQLTNKSTEVWLASAKIWPKSAEIWSKSANM